MRSALALRVDQDRVAGQRFGDSRPLIHVVEHKFCSAHAERIEDALLLELIQSLAGYDLNDASEHVGGMTVAPQCAWLARQRQFGNPLCEDAIVKMTFENARLGIGLLDPFASDVTVADLGRM